MPLLASANGRGDYPPSLEQGAIITAPLQPMSVIACAGSGKTFTAVRRLAHIRRCLG
ncbi:UvrD-helicase domain-containing protein, partial [Xanthomonas citri pv. citri]